MIVVILSAWVDVPVLTIFILSMELESRTMDLIRSCKVYKSRSLIR